MLHELSIRNFAIIDDLNLSLSEGMTVLSGETGAGKSILVDALGLVLGDRADSDTVRDGQQRAEISAVFTLDDTEAAQNWLADRSLDDGDECLVRRVVPRDGRSRNWINGSPASARDLKALGECLVDIHGQHAHQSLLRQDTQRDLLDTHAACATLRETLAETAAGLRDTDKRIRELEGADDDGNLRLDLLRYQVDELRALDLGDNEIAELEAEHQRLANAERLIADSQHAMALLAESEEGAASDLLARTARLLNELAELDPQLATSAEMAESARIQVQETADGLRRAVDGFELDPARLAQVESRLEAVQDLARKHHCTPAELPEVTAKLTTELAELEGAEGKLEALREEHAGLLERYREQAARLSDARASAAEALAAEVTAHIRELGMPQGIFEISVAHDPEAHPAPSGTDRVAYRVSANPGQAPRALEKTASGGELSRISLAIQVVAATANRVPTLIFDEVDAGIGGGVAEIVGQLLRQLGGGGQVLCVTHLPQVAAQAGQHLNVSKRIEAGHTRTLIEPLAPDHRIEEVARMLGGVDITERTRAHAREMIERAAATG